MIIDFHTHVFPDQVAAGALKKLSAFSHTRPFTDGTQAGLLASMEEAEIDISVILPVATSPGQVPRINDGAIGLSRVQWSVQEIPDTGHAAKREKRLLSFGAMHPFYEDWEAELERIAQAGLRGIKIHPPYQGACLDDDRYIRIVRKAESLGLITVTHAGWDIGLPDQQWCSPDMACRLLEQTKAQHLVLAHMGGWRMWAEVCEKLADTPVFLDTSFSTGMLVPLKDGYYQEEDLPLMGKEDFLHMVEVFSPKRLLFGTDSPWSGQKESIEWMRGLPMEEEASDTILGKNAKRLLRL